MRPALTASLTFATLGFASLIASLSAADAPRWSLVALAGVLLLAAVGFAIYHLREPVTALGRKLAPFKRARAVRKIRREGRPPKDTDETGGWRCPFCFK